jgi:4a-hydroxytetrahydrobiopterin dehydratase
VLGELRTQVLTGSLPLAADVAGRVAALPGTDGHLRMDVRPDRALLSVQSFAQARVTLHDVELARRISAMIGEELRLTTRAGADGEARTVQVLEIGLDALDIPKVRPFWKAVLGYVDETGGGNGLVDPLGQGPAVWFQQMDTPRPQRNRMHIDVSRPRLRPTAGSSPTRRRPRSGCWPTPRATRHASRPGRAGTYGRDLPERGVDRFLLRYPC